MKLFAHNDPFEILTKEDISKTLSPISSPSYDGTTVNGSWDWNWLLKTTVIVTDRGLVCSMGWILEFEKDKST